MAKLMTAPDLDAKQVEDVAQAIQRAELSVLFPRHAAASKPVDSQEWKDYWTGQVARTRMSYRQQAIAALRASQLLERVAQLEQAIERALTDLSCYGHDATGDARARYDAKRHLVKVHDKQIV